MRNNINLMPSFYFIEGGIYIIRNIKTINTLILSMSAEQKVLDELKSDYFSVDIFSKYIESLMFVNLRLLGLTELIITKYKDLISLYLHGVIKDPNEIIKMLKK